jgi:shikimate dehydrogenase
MFYRFGLIGHPTAHSLSPAIHKAALKHFNLSGNYELIDTPERHLVNTLAYVRNEGFHGFNVTIPHKQSFLRLANSLTDSARLAQAVNCVKIDEEGLLVGHNTDLEGFKKALSGNFAGETKSAFVLGNGGAARAAIWGLIELGCRQIVVLARDMAKAEHLIDQIKQALAESKISPILIQAQSCYEITFDFQPQLIVNATSIGLNGNVEAFHWICPLFANVGSQTRFMDMVYAQPPKTTALIEIAKANSLKCQDGLTMLVEQAKLSFDFWTNLNCPIEVMLKAVGYMVKQQTGDT